MIILSTRARCRGDGQERDGGVPRGKQLVENLLAFSRDCHAAKGHPAFAARHLLPLVK